MSTKRYFVLPDVQVPFHNKRMWRSIVQFIEDYQPDKLFSVGDFTDSTQLGRWVRGSKGEFDGGLQQAFDMAHQMLADVREVYNGPFTMVRSNHDDRLEKYLVEKAPALEGLRDLTIERQLRLDELDIEFVHKLVDMAPGWVLAHGDEGNMSSIAGQTAMKLAKKIGKSVVAGHCHRAGLTAESYGYNGKTETLWGVDVGHIMDLDSGGANYLKTGTGNWQACAGALLYVTNTFVQPTILPIQKSKFIVEGKIYGV